MQQWENITTDNIRQALTKSQKWKSPGNDKVPNFWLYHLSSIHKTLAKSLLTLVNNSDEIPDWITESITYLMPKTSERDDLKNYRPITCLCTTYKLIRSILWNRTYSFFEANNILPLEQKGCGRGSYSCKDQLLINKMVMLNCIVEVLAQRRLIIIKAFDSVPHSWILKTLEMYKVSPLW